MEEATGWSRRGEQEEVVRWKGCAEVESGAEVGGGERGTVEVIAVVQEEPGKNDGERVRV